MPWDDKVVEAAASGYLENLEKIRSINYTQALNEALDIALAKMPEVFILGQGATDPGAMFGVCKNLENKHGGLRVFDTPVSEEGLTGFCVGAAMSGLRPVYLHNRPDFLLLTFNQLVTHAAKYHYMSNGLHKVPMVVWSAIGRGWGSGAQHTQAIQGLLMGVPGLKIVMPSTAYDAKGLMLAAIEDNNPVIIFEHRWLMKKSGSVPAEYYTVPLSKAAIRKSGSDLTIIGSSLILDQALEVAFELEAQGISVEVVDLRTLWPWDEETVCASVSKTGRALIVDTGWELGGVCAEIGFVITERCFGKLKRAPERLGLPQCPTPSSHILENAYYPNKDKIKAKIISLMGNL
jgi:acetoin:2,6-dichlorophenolindophenol oxidoreductase subunit beta